MDRRSWPWKKKSSEKHAGEKEIATLDSDGASLASEGSQNHQMTQDTYKKPSYVQISVESYTHLNGLEDQVNAYEEQFRTYTGQIKKLDEQIEELNEKLSDAQSEMIDKEELVKQHAKVAEEAVSGWEKAEAEAATLKTHLEAVTLTKLTAEDRATQLDGALKECMRQIRNLNEEHERQLQEVVLTKNKHYDKMKLDFEAKMSAFDRELKRAHAENDALSRSLQERSNMLIKRNEEKSQAEAEIEILKDNIETCEREINSLKYELHIVSKELEIRNDEKNMTAKSAEAATKQQMESVKKIAKLEAECQRLRSLVRKKLPGPAALAQMKLEVEYLGQGYGETRYRRSTVKPASHVLSQSPHMSPITEFSVGGPQKLQKENEFLTERLFAVEEETKMLKEVLANRNSELQASRSMAAKTANKLQSLEAQLYTSGQRSMTSMSEDGNDDATSGAESWASTALLSEVSQIKDKPNDKPIRADKDSTNSLQLMDDFLEMEKLASLSSEKQAEEDSVTKEENTQSGENESLVMKIQSRISKVFESVSDDAEIEKMLEDIKHIVQESYESIHPHSVDCVFEEKLSSGDSLIAVKKEISFLENGGIHETEKENLLNKEMVSAISEIHKFISSLVEAAAVDEDAFNDNVDQFNASFNKALCNEIHLADFIIALSIVAEKASDLSFKLVGFKNSESEAITPDCIDKIALPENKESQGESYSNGCSHISDSSFNSEEPSVSCKCSMESIEQLKVERDNLVHDLNRSMEEMETTKSHLQQTEQTLAEVSSQLADSQKTNGLAETQLKCMAESYKSLETKVEELENEINRLQTRVESMEGELQSEKASHQDALIRCKDLEEQLERSKECSVCASMAAELESKTKREKELESAAEKLAECQETIFQLGKQLNLMNPPPESDKYKEVVDEDSRISGVSSRDSHLADADTASSSNSHKLGIESPVSFYNNTPPSPSNTNTHGFPRSPSSTKHVMASSGSSAATEKHSRGFSRFFSSKSSSRR